MTVKRAVERKETNMRLLEARGKLNSIDSDLQGIKRDMLLINDYESLAGKSAGLEEASFKLRVVIKGLLKDIYM